MGETPEHPKPFSETNPIVVIIDMQDKDNPDLPNGDFTVVVENVEKNPPSPGVDLKKLFNINLIPDENVGTKKCNISSTKSFVGLWGDYNITLKVFPLKFKWLNI